MAERSATWKRVKFSELAECINDRVDDPKAAGVDRYVGLEHLDPESLSIRRWGTPNDVESTKLRFKPGDIIFGKRRAYQRKLAVADFEGICSAHAMVLRAKPQAVLPEFLPFFMQSDLFMERAVAISVGSLSPTINWKTLATEEFAIPSLEAQRRLTQMFSALRLNIEAAAECSLRAESLVASARERLLATDSFRPLGDLLARIEAGSSPSGTNEPPERNESGVIRVSAVGQWGFVPSESKTLVSSIHFDPARTVRAGDLLITRANTAELVGMSCLVETSFSNLMLSDKTLRLVPTHETSASYLLEALWTANVRRQLRAIATGTGAAMKNISQEKLRGIEVPWLVPEQQTEALRAIQQMKSAHRLALRRVDEAQSLFTHCVSRLVASS